MKSKYDKTQVFSEEELLSIIIKHLEDNFSSVNRKHQGLCSYFIASVKFGIGIELPEAEKLLQIIRYNPPMEMAEFNYRKYNNPDNLNEYFFEPGNWIARLMYLKDLEEKAKNDQLTYSTSELKLRIMEYRAEQIAKKVRNSEDLNLINKILTEVEKIKPYLSNHVGGLCTFLFGSPPLTGGRITEKEASRMFKILKYNAPMDIVERLYSQRYRKIYFDCLFDTHWWKILSWDWRIEYLESLAERAKNGKLNQNETDLVKEIEAFLSEKESKNK